MSAFRICLRVKGEVPFRDRDSSPSCPLVFFVSDLLFAFDVVSSLPVIAFGLVEGALRIGMGLFVSEAVLDRPFDGCFDSPSAAPADGVNDRRETQTGSHIKRLPRLMRRRYQCFVR